MSAANESQNIKNAKHQAVDADLEDLIIKSPEEVAEAQGQVDKPEPKAETAAKTPAAKKVSTPAAAPEPAAETPVAKSPTADEDGPNMDLLSAGFEMPEGLEPPSEESLSQDAAPGAEEIGNTSEEEESPLSALFEAAPDNLAQEVSPDFSTPEPLAETPNIEKQSPVVTAESHAADMLEAGLEVPDIVLPDAALHLEQTAYDAVEKDEDALSALLESASDESSALDFSLGDVDAIGEEYSTSYNTPDYDSEESGSIPDYTAGSAGGDNFFKVEPEVDLDVEKIILERLISELNVFKEKVVLQDILIFEMRALLQSGKGFSNILNLDQLLDTFMAVIREKFSVTTTAVLLRDDLDQTHEYYRVRAYHGLNDYFIDENGYEESIIMYKFPKNNGLLWQLIQQGNVFSVQNIKREPRFEHAWRHWNLDILKSNIWCPLIKSGEVLGIMTIGETETGVSIEEKDYAFIQELASIATTNIDSTLKYEKNIRILKNIQTLYDINQQIASVNDFKSLCFETLNKAIEALGAQKANLMLFNKQTQRLEIKVVLGDIPSHIREGINNGVVETKSFSIGEGIAGECAMLRKPIRVNDRHQIPQVGKHEVFCILSVPILYSSELEGVINMTNKVSVDKSGNKTIDPLGRFTEEDAALLVGLADQAAVNLHKARLYNASITDRLTGLYNSRYFEQVYTEKIAESEKLNQPMSLVIMDIDHFKKVNDTYGHSSGDDVLKFVASQVHGILRPDRNDMAFRYGGEEFCLLLPNTLPAEAMELMENFRKKLESSDIATNGGTLKVTTSIGIATCLLDSRDEKTLFENADETLYMCKHNGRNQVRAYALGEKVGISPDMAAKLRELYSNRK